MSPSRPSPLLPAVIAICVGVTTGWVAAFTLALLVDERLATLPGVLAVTAASTLACGAVCWLPRRRFSNRTALSLAPLLIGAAIPLPHLLGDPWLVHELGAPSHDPGPRALLAIGGVSALALLGIAVVATCVRRGDPPWLARASSRTLVTVTAGLLLFTALAAGGVSLLRPPESVDMVADPVLPEVPAVVSEAVGGDLTWTRVRSAVTDRPYQTSAYRFTTAGELVLAAGPGATDLEFFCADANEEQQHLVLAPLGLLHRQNCKVTIRVDSGDQKVFRAELDLTREKRLRVPIAASSGAAGELRLRVEPGLGCTVLVHRIRAERPPDVPRRVVLVSLDTHAAQHMRFGPDATAAIDTSPALRGLVESDDLAVGFTHAVASADWTLPSHATVWSGLRPSQHRLFLREPVTSFDERIVTLPQLLRAGAGVRTIALFSHLRLGPDYGFARGVEFASLYEAPLGRRGRRVVTDALALLDEHRDEDLLLFLHLFDAHTPYTNYPDDHERLLGAVEPHYPEKLYTSRFYRQTVHGKEGMDPRIRSRNLRRHADRFEPKMEASRVAYQLGLRDVDDMLGVFLDGLRELGLYDTADLVLFSDHGEEFFGHALLTHTSLYLENVRVPLVVKVRQDSPFAAAARQAPTYVDASFEAHPTVFRTVLDLFGVASPEPQLNAGGLGLAELLTLTSDRPAVSELHAAPYSDLVQLSVACGGESHGIVTTYLEDVDRWELNREYFELYAPARDPDELHNLAVGGDAVDDPCLDIVLDRVHEARDLPYQSRVTRRPPSSAVVAGHLDGHGVLGSGRVVAEDLQRHLDGPRRRARERDVDRHGRALGRDLSGELREGDLGERALHTLDDQGGVTDIGDGHGEHGRASHADRAEGEDVGFDDDMGLR